MNSDKEIRKAADYIYISKGRAEVRAKYTLLNHAQG